jgi:hypothetical protein
MATTVSYAVTKFYPIGGTPNNGVKIGWIDSADKAAQNDILKITNANTVLFALLYEDSNLATIETHSISDNSITLTSANTGAVTGIVVYK